jgi:hypothetical protein
MRYIGHLRGRRCVPRLLAVCAGANQKRENPRCRSGQRNAIHEPDPGVTRATNRVTERLLDVMELMNLPITAKSNNAA